MRGKLQLGLMALLLFSGLAVSQKVQAQQNPRAVFETNKGTFVIELYPSNAPKTVENFMKLTNEKFYDGVIFHRYVEDYVIQGGDPTGTGTGGPGYTIPDEHENGLTHVKGAVGMARTPEPNSAGSQFYIVLEPAHRLDNQYTVFGQVVEGMEVVMNLRAQDRMERVSIQMPEAGAEE